MNKQSTANKPLAIIRMNEVVKRRGIPKSTLYELIDAGLMPPGISLGCRSVGWPDYEIDAINAFLIAGNDTHELKPFVSELIEHRKSFANWQLEQQHINSVTSKINQQH